MTEKLSEKQKLATEHPKYALADAIFSFAALKRLVISWSAEQTPMIDALCLAVMFHVLLFPILWAMGWMLPFPRSPVITTIIEYDLTDWPHNKKPKRVIDFRDPKFNHN